MNTVRILIRKPASTGNMKTVNNKSRKRKPIGVVLMMKKSFKTILASALSQKAKAKKL